MEQTNLKNNKDYKQLRKEVKIIEKAIENFLQKAIDNLSEKDFALINL